MKGIKNFLGTVFSKEIDPKLWEAAEAGKTAEVKRLLGKGMDVDAKNEWDETPLMKAAGEGRTETAKALIDAALNGLMRARTRTRRTRRAEPP
jgi:ankyrin repeat protein